MTNRLRFSDAQQVFDAFPTAREDIDAEPSDANPLVFLENLVTGPTPEDAIGFCAYLLPRREAVWWACQCVRTVEQQLTPQDEEIMQAAELWVREPEEENRREALNAGMNAQKKTAAVWIALAAGWSGGSMTQESQPAVVPPYYLTAQSVRAAVLTTLARVERARRSEILRVCVDEAKRLVASDSN